MRPVVLLCLLAPVAIAADKVITAEGLRSHVRFLASDLLEGRAPASHGDEIAEHYIATQFEGAGLKPAGTNGTWLQTFEIVGVSGHPTDLKVTSKGGGATMLFKFWEDFIAVAGEHQPESTLDASELVFVGYGITAPEYAWDDFKGMDLKGKTLLVMNNDPEDDPKIFAGKTRLYYGRWDYKYEMAQKLGAAGCLIIHTQASAGYGWRVVQTSWTGEQFDLPYSDGPRVKVKGWVTEDAARKLAKAGGQDLDALRRAAQSRDFKPVPLNLSVSTSFKNIVQHKQTANVLGLLPGSDPKLARELIVYTAHHDHLGRNENAKPGDDAIYNGAVDNAAGSAALLSVMHAMASQPKAPKRSVLFAAVAAEEQGLLGSQYLVEHPPVPVGLMAVDINIDGANIWGRTRDVSVIGLGKSSVDDAIIKLAKAQGRVVKPDELSDRGFFYRSDQFNFARWGVPAAYFSSGHDFLGKPEGWGKKMREEWEEKHYHQPSDELTDAWDLSGAVEDTQLYYELGNELGSAPKMPTWNKGDEFEAARMRALQAVGATR